jgi:hypothetical protein
MDFHFEVGYRQKIAGSPHTSPLAQYSRTLCIYSARFDAHQSSESGPHLLSWEDNNLSWRLQLEINMLVVSMMI